MPLSHLNTTKGRRAVTLIEMLTVIFVVSILVALVVGTTRYATGNSQIRRAKADLQLLADALDRFQLRFGELPSLSTDEVDVEMLLNFSHRIPGSHGESETYYFSNSLPHNFSALDPWGKPYRYVLHLPRHSGQPETYSIYSEGPDPKKKERYRDELTL